MSNTYEKLSIMVDLFNNFKNKCENEKYGAVNELEFYEEKFINLMYEEFVKTGDILNIKGSQINNMHFDEDDEEVIYNYEYDNVSDIDIEVDSDNDDASLISSNENDSPIRYQNNKHYKPSHLASIFELDNDFIGDDETDRYQYDEDYSNLFKNPCEKDIDMSSYQFSMYNKNNPMTNTKEIINEELMELESIDDDDLFVINGESYQMQKNKNKFNIEQYLEYEYVC